MHKELREQLRYELRVPVEIEWESNTGKQKAMGFTKDISSNGVFVFCKPDIPLGTDLHLAILLRTDGVGPKITLDVTAKVCRVVKPIAKDELSGFAVQNYRFKMTS
jgi:hypothetical protein